MGRFTGKTAIITGASSGIGEATARLLAAEGANVVLASRTRSELQRVASNLDGDASLIQVTDVSVEGEVQALIDASIERFGQIDVLVNNAGVAVQGDITEISTEDYRKVTGTIIDGTFFACRAALPHLVKTGGAVVNTSSVSGLGGDWGMSVYNLAKGAISNLTRALALDYGQRGVRINAVAPTLTRTGMTKDMFDDSRLLDQFMDRIPMDRPGEPEDIAAAIAYLASQDARFVTGVILPVDGGLMASNGQPKQA
ncbi:SDR family oxidoreductase [Paracoccus sp. TK19116]|uniref:SDR family oxidoreductase n=1 Tax=Paracoccus albicereus TaxID=2922394 RepID=A0ABT1MQ70_9RHOB|nr:SDR family oxidoreductase [Paracoccus albicereus]MCQ0970455.1 SDR family oxidoreductase [Paracoccus albicereus]